MQIKLGTFTINTKGDITTLDEDAQEKYAARLQQKVVEHNTEDGAPLKAKDVPSLMDEIAVAKGARKARNSAEVKRSTRKTRIEDAVQEKLDRADYIASLPADQQAKLKPKAQGKKGKKGKTTKKMAASG